MESRGLSAELIVGLAVLALSGIVVWQAGEIAASPLYAQVGPKFVPYAVGLGLGLLGAGLIAAATIGGWRTEPDDAGGIDWRAMGWLGAGDGDLRRTRPGLRRRADAHQPAVVHRRRDARHRGRRAARPRAGGDHRAAAAPHLQGRRDRGLHPVRRHLLRRDVWRLDDVDPAQHARRERHHRHRDGGQQDGPQRGRGGAALATAAIGSFVAGTIGTARPRLLRPDGRRPRAELRPGRVFRADGARLHHRLGGARQLGAARPHQPLPRLFIGSSASTCRPARRASPSAWSNCSTAST
jgi:hypothetical protein